MINELPKEHRFRKKFRIPAYIYCDKHNPNMLTFLNPLFEKLNTLYDLGIQVPGTADENVATVRCMLFMVTADLPARAALMNMKQFKGKFAYNLCKSGGTAYGQYKIRRCWPYEQNTEEIMRHDQIDFATWAIKKTCHGRQGTLSFRQDPVSFRSGSFFCNWLDALCLSRRCEVHHAVPVVWRKQRNGFLYGSEQCTLVPQPPFHKAAGYCRKTAKSFGRLKALESNWIKELAPALFCGSSSQSFGSYLPLSLDSPCQWNRNTLLWFHFKWWPQKCRRHAARFCYLDGNIIWNNKMHDECSSLATSRRLCFGKKTIMGIQLFRLWRYECLHQAPSAWNTPHNGTNRRRHWALFWFI